MLKLTQKQRQLALERLREGREFLAQNEWTTGHQKKKLSENTVEPKYAYCAYGALRYCRQDQKGLSTAARVLADTIQPAESRQYDADNLGTIFSYNDSKNSSTGKAAVLKQFDKAIERLAQRRKDSV